MQTKCACIIVISISRNGLLKACARFNIERSEKREKLHVFKRFHFEHIMVLFTRYGRKVATLVNFFSIVCGKKLCLQFFIIQAHIMRFTLWSITFLTLCTFGTAYCKRQGACFENEEELSSPWQQVVEIHRKSLKLSQIFKKTILLNKKTYFVTPSSPTACPHSL